MYRDCLGTVSEDIVSSPADDSSLFGITACKRYQGTERNVLGGTLFRTAKSMIGVDCPFSSCQFCSFAARVRRVCAIARYGDVDQCLCKVHADTLQTSQQHS